MAERSNIAHLLMEWSCGHILSMEDSEFNDYSAQVEDRKAVPFMERRCPQCRLRPFFRRISDLEEVALRFMEDGAKRAAELRKYIEKLTAQHKQTVREFIAEGLNPTLTLSETLQECDSGDRLCHNWMVMESVIVGAFQGEIEDCEQTLRGLRRRFIFLRDVVEVMGGMLALPRQWLNEHGPPAQVDGLYAKFVRWAEDIRGWVARHIREKFAEFKALDENLVLLKKLRKAQQDQTCRLLSDAKCPASTKSWVTPNSDPNRYGESDNSRDEHTFSSSGRIGGTVFFPHR